MLYEHLPILGAGTANSVMLQKILIEGNLSAAPVTYLASPFSSPTRTTDDLLELTQQMTPSKPPEVLHRIRRDIQSHANNIRDEFSTLKRRLTDLEHQSATTQPARKTRKRGRRAILAMTPSRTRRPSRSGHTRRDEDFDENDEFTSDKKKIQGQLRRILQFLPNDVKHLRTTELISGAFTDGMSGQRSTTSNRLRSPSLAKIVDDVKPFNILWPLRWFAKLIGYQPGTDTCEPYYSKLDVPILPLQWQGQAPAAKTVEKLYKIQWTTLGAIAIWLHSADTQLSEIGDETGINYRERHSYYMQRIVEALVSKKAWAVDLVAYWDHILFPDADKPHANAAGSAGDQPDEDDDDFFGSAPAVVSPARLIRPTTPINTSLSGRDESSTSPAPPARNNHQPPPPQRSHSPTPQPRHSASARSEGVRRRHR
ncbi:hypothetical protein B0H10DRAFT_2200622 [Mycena sp. CBHHK59/15]|nr:hypothetical protein B0H10DRAFT_2200622 [Mycena sp. CBHHK59/15]